jgi:hypothetical protein
MLDRTVMPRPVVGRVTFSSLLNGRRVMAAFVSRDQSTGR